MAGHLRRDNRINSIQFKNNGERPTQPPYAQMHLPRSAVDQNKATASGCASSLVGDGLEGPAGNIHQSMMIMASEITT
jgi:hypothetical protein